MEATKEQVSSITIIGRRWFERVNGNTYYSAEIIVNGNHVHKIDFSYGYGNQFEWDAAAWLEKAGYLPGRKHHGNGGGGESLWRYCDERKIAFVTSASDVSRKKDL